ncbi:MAG: SDR family oxidoreductase [Rhodobacteraceae bacterium]|nr:SDR family oxidoreductase [Paracoccaceae bacterium]
MTKVALVTGGARGIGRAIALDLARDHQVAITWLTTEPADLADTVLAIRSDLTKPDSAKTVVEQVIARFGQLDVIINNAGSVISSAPDSFDPEALRAMLDINLLAPGTLLAAALLYLKPGASVVNISSGNAVLPPRGAAIYGASKAALNLWTRGMAKELGPRGIRVNAVAPGATNLPGAPRSAELTQLFVNDTALGRIGTPQDVARAVRFMASDEAGFITGQVLEVSGGYRL